MQTAQFDRSKVPRARYQHLEIEPPINWSAIIRIDKVDIPDAESAHQDDRDTYCLEICYDWLAIPARWIFHQDRELRDKVFDLVVSHQIGYKVGTMKGAERAAGSWKRSR